MLRFTRLGFLTCAKLPVSLMSIRRCTWVSSASEQMCAFDLDRSCAFPASPLAGGCVCTERPGQGQSLKLKQLLNSQWTGFHNMRGLRNKGVSRLNDWTGMSSSLQYWWDCFWKLNIWCDGWVLLTGMCQYLLSPCWSLMIIYVAGCRKSDGLLKLESRARLHTPVFIFNLKPCPNGNKRTLITQ